VYANGGTSWVAIIPFLVVVAVRMLSSQRRRQGGRPGVPGPARGFTATGPPTATRPPNDDASTSQTTAPSFTGTAPGWFVDPFVRHEQRYWSGTGWTEHVMDGGVPATDPPPPPASRA